MASVRSRSASCDGSWPIAWHRSKPRAESSRSTRFPWDQLARSNARGSRACSAWRTSRHELERLSRRYRLPATVGSAPSIAGLRAHPHQVLDDGMMDEPKQEPEIDEISALKARLD